MSFKIWSPDKFNFDQKIFFVCVNEREAGKPCCAAQGGREVRDALKALVEERGLKSRVRVSQAKCLDYCGQGPVVAVFPDNVYYKGVKAEDVKALVERHCRPGPAK